MSRTPTETLSPAPAPALIESKFDELSENANALIVMNEQDKANVKAMAVQLGYSGPTDPDTLEQACQIKGAAAAHAIFEFGAALVLLRESCLHGDWMERFERMSISRRTAHNYMTIALRFKGTDVRTALAGLGVNKMLELAALNDDEIEELMTEGTLRGHQVGAVDRMTVREMKKRIAELESNAQANDRLVRAKDEKLNELTRKETKFSFEVDWPQQVGGAVQVVEKYSAESEKFLGVVMQACTQTMDAAPKDEAQQQVWAQGAAALAARVRDAMARQREVIEAAETHFRSTLGLYLED